MGSEDARHFSPHFLLVKILRAGGRTRGTCDGHHASDVEHSASTLSAATHGASGGSAETHLAALGGAIAGNWVATVVLRAKVQATVDSVRQ